MVASRDLLVVGTGRKAVNVLRDADLRLPHDCVIGRGSILEAEVSPVTLSAMHTRQKRNQSAIESQYRRRFPGPQHLNPGGVSGPGYYAQAELAGRGAVAGLLYRKEEG